MSDPSDPSYRLGLRIRGDRLLVELDGPPGPDADRHLREVRAAAAKCDLVVVVHQDAQASCKTSPSGTWRAPTWPAAEP